MLAWRLYTPKPAEAYPLVLEDLPVPEPGPGQVLLRVRACGVCHTDLHTVEGEIQPPRYPITPGHQVVATVENVGPGVDARWLGRRVGVTWLYKTCGTCTYCRRGRENLCEQAQFTGFHADGGYAEYMVAYADYVFPLPQNLDDVHAAPLLCAGVIGYRTLRVAEVQPGETVALFGFGASAHLVIQVLRHWENRVLVFTRSPKRQAHARELGAVWAGHPDDPAPEPYDRALIFAPAGEIVHRALAGLRPGGTVAINAIYMTSIPEMPYDLIYRERGLRSVANVTRADARAFLRLAGEIPLQTTVQPYSWLKANEALADLKAGKIVGQAVLVME